MQWVSEKSMIWVCWFWPWNTGNVRMVVPLVALPLVQITKNGLLSSVFQFWLHVIRQPKFQCIFRTIFRWFFVTDTLLILYKRFWMKSLPVSVLEYAPEWERIFNFSGFSFCCMDVMVQGISNQPSYFADVRHIEGTSVKWRVWLERSSTTVCTSRFVRYGLYVTVWKRYVEWSVYASSCGSAPYFSWCPIVSFNGKTWFGMSIDMLWDCLCKWGKLYVLVLNATLLVLNNLPFCQWLMDMWLSISFLIFFGWVCLWLFARCPYPLPRGFVVHFECWAI